MFSYVVGNDILFYLATEPTTTNMGYLVIAENTSDHGYIFLFSENGNQERIIAYDYAGNTTEVVVEVVDPDTGDGSGCSAEDSGARGTLCGRFFS